MGEGGGRYHGLVASLGLVTEVARMGLCMRGSRPVGLALPVVVAVLALCAAPAVARPATTPMPPPRDPNAPPASARNGPQPWGRAIGDAGTGLSMIRILPASAPTNTILP